MDKATAIRTINGLKFMPGWRFQAFDFGVSDTIMARALIDTVNSDQDKAIMDYPQHITLERGVMIHVTDYADTNALAAAAFMWISEIMIHESREFLRLGTEGHRAPFHPHRPEGEDNWSALVAENADDPMRGMIVLNV
jgi:hypothetical protein